MSTRHLPMAIIVALCVLSCKGPIPSGRAPIAIGPQASERALAVGTVSISVRAPRGFIGNGAGSFIGNGAGSLIGSDGASVKQETRAYALEAEGDPTAPIVGAEVYLADAAGNRIAGLAAGATDARGQVVLANVPAGFTLLLVAVFKSGGCAETRFNSIVRTTGRVATVGVDPASTLVTSAALEARSGALGTFNAAAFERAVGLAAGQLAASALPDFCDPAAVLVAVNRLIAASAELRGALDGVKKDLAEVKGSLAELKAQVERLATLVPTPRPPLPAAKILGSYAVGAVPRTLLFDAEGNLWVTNYKGDTVTKLSPAGATLGTFDVGRSPLGLARDAQGHIWVANYTSNNVMKLSTSGEVLATLAVDTPFGVAFDKAGNTWVASYMNKKVVRFSAAGGSRDFPVGARPFGLTIDAADQVWVTNNAGHSLSKLSAAGEPLGMFPVDKTPHLVQPDSSGNIWVTATDSNRLDKLAPSGEVLGTFDTGGGEPWGLAVDRVSGNVWVANHKLDAQCVSKFRPTGEKIGTWDVGGTPEGIAVDAFGNAWIALKDANKVIKLPPEP